MIGRTRGLACAALLLGASVPASAIESVDEYARRAPIGDVVAPLGADLFGDQVSYYAGTTRFSITDVALPGKGPALAVGRTHVVGSKGGKFFEELDGPRAPGAFGEWDLDIPHLRGMFSLLHGWQVVGAAPTARCSAPTDSATIRPPDHPHFYGDSFWDGHFLHLPGQGAQRVLLATTPVSERPQASASYRWNTTAHWHFSCTALKNGAGEGFIGHAPDGTKYFFDHLVHERANTLLKGKVYVGLERAVGMLYPTRVVDRFGNTTTYSWSGDRLVRISGTDGRGIDLGYAMAGSGLSANQKVAWITDGTGTWRYAYSPEGFLRSVTLPDGSSWQLQTTTPWMETTDGDPTNPKPTLCAPRGLYQPRAFVYRMTHPSGAVGEFTFEPRMHGRARVHPDCAWDEARQEDRNRSAGKTFFTMSLVRKKVSGLALPERTWTLAYSGHEGSWASCTNCNTIKHTEVTDNAGDFTRYYFSMHFGVSEGRLLEQHEGRSGVVLRRTWHYYDTPTLSPAPAYRRVLGVSGDYWGKDPADEMQIPHVGVDLLQDDTAFHWRVDVGCGGTFCFDAFARPLSEHRYNGAGMGRRDRTEYHDDRQRWVLGQVARTSTDGIEVARTEFDDHSMPARVFAFGKLQSTWTWNADGTMASEADGNGNLTRHSMWRHGIAKEVRLADGAFVMRDLHPNGTLARQTHNSGEATCYEYDAMRRVIRITQASETRSHTCDTATYAPTTIEFRGGYTPAYGVPAGHWRRTTHTGNGRHVQVFDALWRPVIEQWLDHADVANTLKEVVIRYDASGRESFRSHPMNSGGTTHYADTSLKGTHTTYDGLGRVVRVEEDSELGRLVTTTTYLPNGQTRVTNPRGQSTITSHQFFDAPDYTRPTSVLHPGGMRTDIVRDVFGKPLTISRTGPGG